MLRLTALGNASDHVLKQQVTDQFSSINGVAATLTGAQLVKLVAHAKDGGLLNAGSDFARSKLEKQLAFLKDSKELDQVSGGFFPFIATGVALGILYCMADGTFDPPPAPKGDFPSGPKNVG